MKKPLLVRRLGLAGLLGLGLLSSCTQNLFVTKQPLPAPTTLAVGSDYQYRIRKDDKISLTVFDHEELSIGSVYSHYSVNENEGKWELVDAAGNLNVAKIGDYHVEGLTLPEAEQQLEKQLGKWIVNPQITLKVLNKEVTVLGEVNLPGNARLDKDHNTLVQVLGKAGDFGVYADKRRVKLVRQVGATTQATELDLTKLSFFEQSNILVLPGDVVYVPSKNGKQFDRKAPSILGVASIVSAIFIIIRYVHP
ncbi:MAG: polysaccharide export protein [Cytophagaceae bacterium]|nr:MAG: polysaccharide export protein [Cytophagaceae bacterium]